MADSTEIGEVLTDLLEERLAKYRLMAELARESADGAQFPEVKAAFNAVAMAWEAMIVECERAHNAKVRSELKPQVHSPR